MHTVTNDTVPWRLRDTHPSPDGALARDQMQGLADRYGLTANQLLDLSRKVDIALSRELNISAPELVEDRARRGRRELESAIKDLAVAKKSLARSLDTLDQVNIKNPSASLGMQNQDRHHREALERAGKAIEEAKSYFQTAARHDLARFTGHPDKRRAYDIRREIVCTGIFNVWIDAGRPLVFTTDPITSKRGGPLLEFVNAIVGCITDPSTTLSGEAIKTEIERFKAYGARQ